MFKEWLMMDSKVADNSGIDTALAVPLAEDPSRMISMMIGG